MSNKNWLKNFRYFKKFGFTFITRFWWYPTCCIDIRTEHFSSLHSLSSVFFQSIWLIIKSQKASKLSWLICSVQFFRFSTFKHFKNRSTILPEPPTANILSSGAVWRVFYEFPQWGEPKFLFIYKENFETFLWVFG